jgi:hypothetical protein
MVLGLLGDGGLIGGLLGGGGGVLGGIPIVGDLLGGNNRPPPAPTVQQQCASNRTAQAHAASAKESSKRSCCLGQNVHHASGKCSYIFTCHEIGLSTDIGSAGCSRYRGDYCDTKQKVLFDKSCKEYCKRAHSGCMRNTADYVKRAHCLNNPSAECACINFKPTNQADKDMLTAMSPTDLGAAGNPACFASACKGTNVYHLDNWWAKDGAGNPTVARCRAVTICNIDLQNTSMDAADQAQIVIENNCGQDSLAVGGQISGGQTVRGPGAQPATNTGSSPGTMAQPTRTAQESDSDVTMLLVMGMIGLLVVVVALKKPRGRRHVA